MKRKSGRGGGPPGKTGDEKKNGKNHDQSKIKKKWWWGTVWGESFFREKNNVWQKKKLCLLDRGCGSLTMRKGPAKKGLKGWEKKTKIKKTTKLTTRREREK